MQVCSFLKGHCQGLTASVSYYKKILPPDTQDHILLKSQVKINVVLSPRHKCSVGFEISADSAQFSPGLKQQGWKSGLKYTGRATLGGEACTAFARPVLCSKQHHHSFAFTSSKFTTKQKKRGTVDLQRLLWHPTKS